MLDANYPYYACFDERTSVVYVCVCVLVTRVIKRLNRLRCGLGAYILEWWGQRRNHALDRRHLANTTERSVLGGDACCRRCRISVASCFGFFWTFSRITVRRHPVDGHSTKQQKVKQEGRGVPLSEHPTFGNLMLLFLINGENFPVYNQV